MNNADHISESLERMFWVKILKFFDADPGWKKFGKNILGGFATLLTTVLDLVFLNFSDSNSPTYRSD
jgi:hypothetical protein